MPVQSTSRMLEMLATLADQNKPESTIGVVQETADLYDAPQLQPDLEQLLSNILGASPSKKHSPMD